MQRPSTWLGALALAALYFVTAKLGIELTVAQGVVTPVWIPTGLSLAALVVFGYRLWPGVALGAFAANAASDVSIGIAIAIAVGNTLEAVIGTFLLRKVGFNPKLERVRDVLALIGFGAVISTMIAATNGATVLLIGGEIDASEYLSRWSLWWFGDSMGALLVAPLLLVALSRPRIPRGRDLLEALAVLVVSAAASLYVFVGGNWRYPYLLFPILVWATLRFNQLGAATTVFFICAIAVFGTVQGSVPIGGATPTESVQILQALIAIVAASLYVLAASLNERDTVDQKLRAALANLAEAQALAHVGSWEWDVQADYLAWSEELYRIHGYGSERPALTITSAAEKVDPADRQRVEMNLHAALEARATEVPPIEYRVVTDDSVRTLRERCAVHYSSSGKPLRVVGMVQDVTKQKKTDKYEQFLRESDMRHRQALALNDSIVQGLVAAKAALDLELHDRHAELITSTLRTARDLVNRLLDDSEKTKPLGPGDFVREEPARLPDPSASE